MLVAFMKRCDDDGDSLLSFLLLQKGNCSGDPRKVNNKIRTKSC